MAKVRLAFLGPPSIERDGVPVHLDTRKAIALMVYLSVIGKPVSRDTLVTLLWSRYGRAEGHAALRRTLSTVRTALGREFIDAEREAVSLPELPDTWIDLSRFRELLTLSASHPHGQPAICRLCLPLLSEAAKLYRGQFLLGFTLKDSVDFDDWQLFTTEKYRLEAVQVLDRLALCSAAAGDFRSAIGYAHERLGLDRLDESAHALLMQLFAWEGNRAAAKHQFDECQRLLEKELNSPPQQATLRLAESIAQGRVPDLPAFANEPRDGGRAPQAGATKSGDSGERDPRLARSEQAPAQGQSTKKRIAVLPFANISPDPNDEYFADGLTEELISAVSKIRGLRTISRSSAMRFKSTDKSVTEIAAELQVGAVIEGSVRKSGSQIRISVQLVDVRSDELLWSQDYNRKLEDIFAIQSDIASKVAQALQVHVQTQERERIEKRATGSIESYNLYMKGLHDRGKETEDGYRSAVRYFEQALKEDPEFALAYAGLAECYDLMGDEGYLPPKESFLKAEKFARKALDLDDSLAEAHATLGAVMQTYYYDQAAAEQEFRSAIELNPNYGKVCNSYGVHLACMGRLDEAIIEIVRAQELSPLALDINSCAAVTYNCANQFDKSVEACERMFRIDENYLSAYRNLAEAYYEKSRYEDAIQVLQKAILLSKGAAILKAHLGFAYARSGRSEEARALLRELEDESNRKYVAPIAFALVHCGLNEKTKAIEWLQKACEARTGSAVLSIKVRPMWASLRSEPAFSQLLERMGLSPSA
jgi:TolB-like protein/DNA-binding SARP family transcriptional activator